MPPEPSTVSVPQTPGRVQATYYILTLGSTLAASLIWGINTLFLLDAGLTNLEAFAANAFYTAGMVLFEIPTGVVADVRGRRLSYLLGTVTLAVSTVLYWLMWSWQAPFAAWALVSVLLGLGFTFFSGAVDAWLVDALRATGYAGSLETVFGRSLVVSGVAMLGGSVLGGVLAQATNLGVPFLVRAGILVVLLAVAALLMRDLGFERDRSGDGPLRATRRVFRASVRHGFGQAPVRWLLLASPFTAGVGLYVFYALQPYLLQAWGDPEAYSVAGAAAALVSGASIVGGALAPAVRRLFRRRTSVILLATATSVGVLLALGVVRSFWAAVALVAVWGLATAIDDPVHRAYLNDMIPSRQRATVLSFDSLLGSGGGVVFQPLLGRTADVWGYGASLLLSGAISAAAVPFVLLSRAQRSPADSAQHVRHDADTAGL